ncbi:MAG TPA: GNAT family N-acetyltransferase [Chitinophagaceae bacterium]|jgi:RimJ/RimL family protein N-acetyltransferase
MYKKLTTERLLIRPITKDDADFILRLANSEGWLKYIGDRNIQNSSDAKNYIQKILDNKKYFYSVFQLKETGAVIGIISFLYRDDQKYPDIGFAILPEFEKQGYSFEAAKKYLDEIIEETDVDRIIGITLSGNTKSIKLLEKLGLTSQENFYEENEQLSLYSLKIRLK